MPSDKMPRIFRSTSRYSEARRPDRGDRCFFSHASEKLLGEFVAEPKSFMHEWIKQDGIVTVVRNAASFVEVRFEDAPQTDYVAPEFLMLAELTAFGQAFFDRNKGMSPRIKKYFKGA